MLLLLVFKDGDYGVGFGFLGFKVCYSVFDNCANIACCVVELCENPFVVLIKLGI